MADFAQQLQTSDLEKPATKQIWVAVLLTVLWGPAGMYYSTAVGCAVMCCLSVLVSIFYGKAAMLLWPVCILWSALAVRSANSIY
jgi:hypothetical protein